MSSFSLARAWKVLLDTLWLGVVRAALTAIQTAVDALGLDEDARRAVVGQLGTMILGPAPNDRTGRG
ncbi:MAG: hypothetical protein KatS3mg117_0611 [Geminicoccaceae bacterium]|nr:MAG: hypothetical protein KatS3mg117_0611 [Geminicoccaceae bacterium]